MMYAYTYDSNWFWHGFFGPIAMIIFWVVAVYFVISLVRNNTNHNGENKKALDYLKERYAKGEITKEQFDSMKKDLTD